MKRILITIKGLGRGGAEQLIATAVPRWDTSRFEYEVAYLVPWKDAFVEEIRARGVRVHCLHAGRGLGWVRRLGALVRSRAIDLVHAHSPIAATACRLVVPRDVRVVYTEHNVWARYHPATRLVNALSYGRNDHTFAVSDEVNTSISAKVPFGARMRARPVETLHHGIDLRSIGTWRPDGVRRELGVHRDAFLFVTVANFKTHKGHSTLIQAAATVARARPDARFVLVGVGPTEGVVRREVDRLGLADVVIFAGFRDDAPRLMAAADAFVLPSEHEGLPIAMIEAMALGRPIVATRVGGVPEVIEHGVHGLLVPPGQPLILAEALLGLMDDPGLRERIGNRAQERAGDFDIERAVRRMEHVYEELLA